MGKVKVKYLGYIADLAGASEVEIDVEGQAKVAEIAPVLRRLRRTDYVLIVDGKGAEPDTVVSPGSVVVILPETGGG